MNITKTPSDRIADELCNRFARGGTIYMNEIADWHLAEIEKAKKERTEECANMVAERAGCVSWIKNAQKWMNDLANDIRAINDPKPVWCEHMTFMESSTQTSGWMVNDGPGSWWLPSSSKFCPICGKPRPDLPKHEGTQRERGDWRTA